MIFNVIILIIMINITQIINPQDSAVSAFWEFLQLFFADWCIFSIWGSDTIAKDSDKRQQLCPHEIQNWTESRTIQQNPTATKHRWGFFDKSWVVCYHTWGMVPHTCHFTTTIWGQEILHLRVRKFCVSQFFFTVFVMVMTNFRCICCYGIGGVSALLLHNELRLFPN